MTTFTLQDLAINDLPNTPEEDEAMDTLARLGAGIGLKEVFTDMGKALADHEIAHQQAQQNLLNTTQHATEPQPTLCESTQTPDLPTIINTICTQLQLLATVIQAKAQPEVDPNTSLQETIALTLQQADWFRTMVRHELVGLDIEAIARDAVESVVEDEVESYFDNRFDVTDHFDFGDAVADRVDEMLDDVVRERVMDSLEEVVAEKLSEASVSISF